MITLDLFELLASQAHFNVDMHTVISKFPEQIQIAILDRDGEKIKSQIAGMTYLANESHVVNVRF